MTTKRRRERRVGGRRRHLGDRRAGSRSPRRPRRPDADANPDPDADSDADADVPTPTPTPAAIKISQVYGGGGNAGATLKNDFIELHNPTDADVVADGWSVQYGPPAGTTWTPTVLTGTIAAGGYYLIQEAAGAGGTLPLPDPDAIGNHRHGRHQRQGCARAHRQRRSPAPARRIRRSSTSIGYGPTANCFEGRTDSVLSNTTAALRNGDGADRHQQQCRPTSRLTRRTRGPLATPRRRWSRRSRRPAPSNVPAYANITLDFNEPVNVTGSWFSIQCTVSGTHPATVSGGPVSFTLNR